MRDDNPLFESKDIVIDETKSIDDKRCGWHDARHVCIKRLGNEGYTERYGYLQCVGTRATDYDK